MWNENEKILKKKEKKNYNFSRDKYVYIHKKNIKYVSQYIIYDDSVIILLLYYVCVWKFVKLTLHKVEFIKAHIE